MKILYDNYLTDSSIVASSQNSAYPVANVIHKFMEKPWKSLFYAATITVVFPEDREIDTIAVGYTDATAFTYDVQNASGTSLQTGNIEYAYDTNMTYIPTVTGRQIVFSMQGTGSIMVGSLSVGKSTEFPYVQANPRFTLNYRGEVSKTVGGQTLGRNYKALRSWTLVIPDMTNAERQEAEAIIYGNGIASPVFIDIYPESHTEEQAMYATISNIGNARRDTKSRRYTMGLEVEEAR